jgi:hypothetical protein
MKTTLHSRSTSQSDSMSADDAHAHRAARKRADQSSRLQIPPLSPHPVGPISSKTVAGISLWKNENLEVSVSVV